MMLKSVSVKNFRCYQDEVRVNISDLTTLIGRNDIGKSSILDALEIFFNNDAVKIEKGDANIESGDNRVEITCKFSDLPAVLTLDAGAETSFQNEYLVSSDGTLKIRKIFDCGKSKIAGNVFILASHPTAEGVSGLLELKEKELQSIVREQGLDVPLKGNPGMRQAIWTACDDLKIQEIGIQVNKPKEDCKRIWEQIEALLPLFALFQSDRDSKDSDGEVQNPMKAAIQAALAEVQPEIEGIQKKVREKAEEIAKRTLDALKDIDRGLASELTPIFKPPTPAKWTGLFSVGMDTDKGIPLNKRGSGVRRLILVSFFKAEAERRLASSLKQSIIYAIEEPETSQHPLNQRIMIESFKSLSAENCCQVLLTTHSPGFAADLPAESIRFISRDADDKPCVSEGEDVFGEVADALGVTPDSRVKVLVCVEGPTDVAALKCLSEALHEEDPNLPNLKTDEKFAFIVLGGSTLTHWVSQNYLKGLGRPEFHLYDRDVSKYEEKVKEVNQREDGSCAALTKKHEIESYLHKDAIMDAFGVEVEPVDEPGVDGKAVPRLFAEAYSSQQKYDGIMGDSRAKIKLAEEAFPLMTAKLIQERDPDGEVCGWFEKLAEMARNASGRG